MGVAVHIVGVVWNLHTLHGRQRIQNLNPDNIMERVLQIVEEARKNYQKVLNLSHRDLKVIPAELSELSSLCTLLLNDNQIIMPPEEISHLQNLECLSLEHNQLTLLPSLFSSLANSLQFLNLSDNPFTYLPPVVSQLVNLRSLWLENIGLTSFPSDVCSIVSLKKLSLARNSISEIGEEIGNLVNLRWLSLAKNKLLHLGHRDSKNSAHFSKLVRLEILVLQDNLLSEFPLVLCSLQNLASVNLKRNKIFSLSSDAVAHIMRSNVLVKLDLRENPFNLLLESINKDYKPNSVLDDPRIMLA